MIQWEYKIHSTYRDVLWDSSDIGPEETIEELNLLGEQGWELICVTNQIEDTKGDLTGTGSTFYFKRIRVNTITNKNTK